METSSQAVLIGTGALPFLVLLSAALTLPVSLGLLALYRRAVLRSMARSGGATMPPPPATGKAAPPDARLVLEDVAAGPAAGGTATRVIRRSLGRAVGVQVAAGLAYAVTLSAAWMVFAWGEGGFVAARFLWLLSCYAWPTALAVGLTAATSRRQRLAIGALYFGLVLAFAGWALIRNPALSALAVVQFWLITNLPATVLLLAFLHRRIRAVGPLVLVFMVTALTGSQLAIALVAGSEVGLRAAVGIGGSLGLGGSATFVALMLAGAALAAVGGWLILGWLGRRHLARRSSDQALTLDAMWLLFAIVQTVSFGFEGIAWMAAGPVAFVVYKVVSGAGWRLAGLGRGSADAPSLLLLRVFALGGRSERLFDALGKRWLRIGDISLIAGPDLATTTVEPHEFLDFAGGRLSRQFVHDEADLERRLAARALGPDPDGRHRVNEFFCHADTWQLAMQRLARGADVVLMDLRSFSASNQGCRYELGRLLDTVPLARMVVLVDGGTDRAFLEDTLQALWRELAADSPNRSLVGPRLQVLRADRADAAVKALPERLLAAARPRPAGG
ncbi:hypothetical protein [Thauera phenolivorans]|uniref:hypothetical protein n=1 Tax=Thauera phenolivorans TaxID=1792543 RepID=UPI00083B8B7C|nr:hypothetical protein [Thauera phenolivorans]